VNEALILAGGLATRLGEASVNVPKCLQLVAGRPFLDHLLWDVSRYGFDRVVLCTGHLHDVVESHVGDGSAFGLEVVYSREPKPLGTGGALALASPLVQGEEVLVLNGDSLIDCNYLDLALSRRSAEADVALALRDVVDVGRFGAVQLDGDAVAAFGEKSLRGEGLASAGAYVASSAWVRSLPQGPSSLEADHFPILVQRGKIAGRGYHGVFVDIGTPDSLVAAQAEVAAWRRKPCAFLDRDGVMNEDRGHVHSASEFRWLPGMPDAIKMLNDAGWLVVVVTNQAGIGRGYYSAQEFKEFTGWVDGELRRVGAHVDATYYCPHHPTAGEGEYLRDCDCRKPAPGMFLRAIDEWQPDLVRSFALGDKASDIEAAEAAGVRGVRYTGGDIVQLVSGLVAGAS